MWIPGSLRFAVRTGKSRIHGRGAFAGTLIPSGKKIGSLAGEVITVREARRKARLQGPLALVELWNGKAIDASQKSNALRYINHSCSPNTYMRTLDFHVEFYALRKIETGEELTCNYGATHHEGRQPCRCGAPACKGFI